jgi:hypothetical protein
MPDRTQATDAARRYRRALTLARQLGQATVARGVEQEPFDPFETTGSSGISGMDPAADYYLTSRQLKDRLHRIKRPACRDCRHDARCPGLWQAYVEHFGWDEFEPLRGGKRPPADEAAGDTADDGAADETAEHDSREDRHG